MEPRLQTGVLQRSARRAAAAKQTEPVDWSPFSRQEEAFRQQLAQRCVLTFADFQRYLKHEQTETKYHDDNDPQWLKGAEQVRAFARQRFATLQRQGGFSPSFAGYRQYLKAA